MGLWIASFPVTLPENRVSGTHRAGRTAVKAGILDYNQYITAAHVMIYRTWPGMAQDLLWKIHN